MQHRPLGVQVLTQPHPPVDLDRFKNLADGIFAVAMTFLAFTIHLPTHTSSHTTTGAGLGAQFANLALSFYVIGRYWMLHNRRHRLVALGNETLVTLELAMLFGIILIPITLRLYNQIPGTFEGVALYSSSFIFIALIDILILLYALRHKAFIKHDTPDAALKITIKLTLLPVAIFATSIVIALFNPGVAPVSWMLLMVMPIVVRRVVPPARPAILPAQPAPAPKQPLTNAP